MDDHPRERQVCGMERTRWHAMLIGRVRTVMCRREKRQTATSGKAPATPKRRRVESDEMARWENEGGAIGHTAGQRPRPVP
jgi:hypothetical protein